VTRRPLVQATAPPDRKIRRRLLRPELPDDVRDAKRWRALMACPNLRIQTTTPQPFSPKDQPGYRYIALDIATHGNGSNHLNWHLLRDFVDHLVALQDNDAEG